MEAEMLMSEEGLVMETGALLPIAVEVIRTAGSLATIANFVKSWFQSGKTEIQEKDREEVLEAARQETEGVPSFELNKILAQIPENHLKPILDRVKRADENYVTIIQGGSMIDVKKAHEITSFDVCALLKLIMKHNDDKLPDDKYLHDLWSSFTCGSIRTVFD